MVIKETSGHELYEHPWVLIKFKFAEYNIAYDYYRFIGKLFKKTPEIFRNHCICQGIEQLFYSW